MNTARLPSRWDVVSRHAYVLLLATACCFSQTGCAVLSASPEVVRQTYTTQQNELFKICPKGTHRDQVEKRLAEAGINGEFGTNQSIYYCDFWKREDGKVWELNLALLFDEEGVLYSTMPGRTQITSVKE
ncbi:hypothetical protein Pla110_14750 [Polystyrenella longa]|uniref:Uncharacterized protein n=1 Tax=Polystyrenella longa TaxID=2528007 RepID=A0A518CKL3_9PLAN|nr:hypothetical protein [Polystyrenella longa]QDU79761.1 hypothetical protein Pla110_14750 [Polystyrenella longa]